MSSDDHDRYFVTTRLYGKQCGTVCATPSVLVYSLRGVRHVLVSSCAMLLMSTEAFTTAASVPADTRSAAPSTPQLRRISSFSA